MKTGLRIAAGSRNLFTTGSVENVIQIQAERTDESTERYTTQ